MDKAENAAKIGSYFEQLISEQVATGRFASETEVLQAGLRLLEEQQLGFLLKKSELNNKDAQPTNSLEGSDGSVSKVSRMLTDAVQTMASATSEQSRAIPAIPATKGLLRSRIAAE